MLATRPCSMRYTDIPRPMSAVIPETPHLSASALAAELDIKWVELTSQVCEGLEHLPPPAHPGSAIGREQVDDEVLLVWRHDPMKLPPLGRGRRRKLEPTVSPARRSRSQPI